MKKQYFPLIVLIMFMARQGTAQNANTTLSNLTSPTKINVSLLPDKTNIRTLGNSNKAWKNIYIDSALFIDGLRFITAKAGSGIYNTGVGIEALKANTTGRTNTAFGFNALMLNTTGISNTAAGAYAMSEATGSYSTAVGSYALSNSTGNNNTAVGSSSMIYNSSGDDNTAVGQYAMHANITGDDNTATGNESLAANTTGTGNVADGSFALWQNIDGAGNTAIGTEALYSDNSYGNTAVGNHSLYNATTGSSNTAVGDGAGKNIKTGSNNLFIGADANSGSTGALTNSAAIGYNVTVTTSNSFIFGNADVTRWGFGVDAGARALKVGTTSANGNGAYLTQGGVWTNTSARNKKEDLQQQDMKVILREINQLSVTKWKYKGTADEYHYGPMADDFHRLFGVGNDSSIADMDKTGILFLGMQQLIKSDEEKDAKIDELQKEIDELKAIITAGHSPANNQPGSNGTPALLQQNIPNPSSNTTTITYSIPGTFSSAKLIITDKKGNIVKTIVLSGNKDSLDINTAVLLSGTYQYSLYADGKLLAVKQMIVSK